MNSHPAQAENLAIAQAVSMLKDCAAQLTNYAEVLQRQPRRQLRVELKRALSGVLADVEVVRVSIRE